LQNCILLGLRIQDCNRQKEKNKRFTFPNENGIWHLAC